MTTLAARLVKAMGGMPRAAVCDRAGISKRTIARIISGKEVHLSTLCALADALDVRLRWLMHDDGEMREPQAAASEPPEPPQKPPPVVQSADEPPAKPSADDAAADFLEGFALALTQLADVLREREKSRRQSAAMQRFRDAIFGPTKRSAPDASSDPEGRDTPSPTPNPPGPDA